MADYFQHPAIALAPGNVQLALTGTNSAIQGVAMHSLLARTPLGAALARSPLRPQAWRASWQAARTLWTAYGHLRTVRTASSVDANGDPVPWYTYPAIEYLKQFDFTSKSVFEYGSGNSTLFWAARAASVTSVEDDEQWYAINRHRVPANCRLLFEPDLLRYTDTIAAHPGGFDIIVVDGPARGRTRYKCAKRALTHLRPGGLIILDNSDWLPQSARLLRESGLIEVDMSGFVPIGGHTQTTSIFLHRSCELEPRDGVQPQPSAGARVQNWEPDVTPQGASIIWEHERIYGIVRTAAFRKLSPAGERVFELAVRDVGGRQRFYLHDTSAQRILLGPVDLPSSDPDGGDQLRRFEAMSWRSFCTYVRSNPMRRYLLEPLPADVVARMA